MNISQAIGKLRRENNLTQSQLGKLLNLSNTTISNYETGVSTPEVDMIINLARLFHVTTDYILDFENDRASDDLKTIPVVSSFKLRNGELVTQLVDTYLKLPGGNLKSYDIIGVYAKDNGMEYSNIFPGDLMLVKKTAYLLNGATGLFLSPDGSWIHRRYYNTNGLITLTPHAASSKFTPIVVGEDQFPFKLIGEVIGLIRMQLDKPAQE